MYLINDLESTAYGLAEINEGYLATIHEGNPAIGGNVAILAPGTGLEKLVFLGRTISKTICYRRWTL